MRSYECLIDWLRFSIPHTYAIHVAKKDFRDSNAKHTIAHAITAFLK